MWDFNIIGDLMKSSISDWPISQEAIAGINLDNYLPQRRTYDSILYIHKKYLERQKSKENKTQKIKAKKIKKNKQDKGQQFDSDKDPDVAEDNTYKVIYNNENPLLEQTIKFAKNIVPLILPCCEDKSQVYYTIKATKKHKKKDKKPRDSSFDHHEPRINKEDTKKVVETYSKVRKESISVKESFSHSSNNTLNDLNVNQSLSCTLSEVSEKKYHKKNKTNFKNPSQGQKITISESFEAVAMENTSGDGKIKIHLMNENDKHFLSDSIKEPLLNAVKEGISECSDKFNCEVSTVQKIVKCNAAKLDKILDKIMHIENKLDNYQKNFDIFKLTIEMNESTCREINGKLAMHENKLEAFEKKLVNYDRKLKTNESRQNNFEYHNILPPQVQQYKPKSQVSVLEDLAEDFIEIRGECSSEEELHHELLDNRCKGTLVAELELEEKSNTGLGGGEVPRSAKNISIVQGKLERPKKIPARFCWTDAGKK